MQAATPTWHGMDTGKRVTSGALAFFDYPAKLADPAAACQRPHLTQSTGKRIRLILATILLSYQLFKIAAVTLVRRGGENGHGGGADEKNNVSETLFRVTLAQH